MEEKTTTAGKREVEEEKPRKAGDTSAWVRRHLADSVYLWACGEKVDDEEEDPTVSDQFIGWLILLGLAYGILVVLARTPSDSDTDGTDDDNYGSGGSEVVLAPITCAMYVLITSTSHDLRAGFSLVVDGSSAGHRAFGLGLVIVYVVMLSASMTVLVSTSDDSASVVLNAVAVLFIADLDEKALKFFSTIPQNWRLFWALESIGISFSLTLGAIYSMGDSFQLMGINGGTLDGYPSWIVWVLNPAAVTMCAYGLSASLEKWFALCSAAFESVDQLTFRSVAVTAFAGLLAAIKRAKERLRVKPCFYAALVMWLVQGAYSWWYLFIVFGPPIAFDFSSGIVADGTTFLFLNAVLVVGIVMKMMRVLCSPRLEHIAAVQEPRRSSKETEPRYTSSSCVTDSRLSSLLVGWGLGYGVTTFLYAFGLSWSDGGWEDAPTAVTALGYVILPCFTLVSLFMVADTNILGTRFEAFIKPAVDILTDRRRVVFWVMATVFRDALLLWMLVTIWLVVVF